MNKPIVSAVIASIALLAATPALASDMPGAKIFKGKCKMCHALDHKKFGPAVKDMSKNPAVLKATITNGRNSMPSFKSKLSTEQIDELVAYFQSVQGK
jgi:mono/diheme cytochrome c family protein